MENHEKTREQRPFMTIEMFSLFFAIRVTAITTAMYEGTPTPQSVSVPALDSGEPIFQ